MVRTSILAALLGALFALPGMAFGATMEDASVAQLKERLAHASPGEQPNLCLEIAQLSLAEASAFYNGNDPDKGAVALGDVAEYSERAGSSAIQARSHEKQTEIAVRKLIRRLGDMKHQAVREDQIAMQSTIDRLERVRDSLLLAMFPKNPHR